MVGLDKASALIVVDMQYDFLPGGSLEVKDGDKIIVGINYLAKVFHENNLPVVFTQDFHPAQHRSFARVHGKNPGDPIDEFGLGPILWPDHCIQNTFGAKISDEIETKYGICIIRKGYHQKIDSYSAFYENDKKSKTGLTGLLKDLEVKKVYICGLALDYCCFYSAIDAKREGFDVYFVQDLTRGIDNPPNNVENALKKMKEADISIISLENFR